MMFKINEFKTEITSDVKMLKDEMNKKFEDLRKQNENLMIEMANSSTSIVSFIKEAKTLMGNNSENEKK